MKQYKILEKVQGYPAEQVYEADDLQPFQDFFLIHSGSKITKNCTEFTWNIISWCASAGNDNNREWFFILSEE
jgi:hypothetical protein